MDWQVGDVIAQKYQLIRKLGTGGSGNVWVAHDVLADEDMVIKFYGFANEHGIEEFRKEFKLAYKLNHPNLLNVGNFDVFKNCPYLVMPFCKKGSVASRIGKMSERDIWRFVEDVSSGLAFLHSQQPPIVHQDIKPDNILMMEDGRYVISDFGISHEYQTRMSIRNTNSVSSGTIAYMGPERFSENPEIVIASDIWSLGMTLYELAVGDVLWGGTGGCAQINGARLPMFIPQVSSDLSFLIKACLAVNTKDRPSAVQIYRYSQSRNIHDLPFVAPKHYVRENRKSSYSSNEDSKSKNKLYFKGNGNKKVLQVLLAIFALLLVGGGVIFIHNNIRERKDFDACKTCEDFEHFVQQYPDSKYTSIANIRIKTFLSYKDSLKGNVPLKKEKEEDIENDKMKSKSQSKEDIIEPQIIYIPVSNSRQKKNKPQTYRQQQPPPATQYDYSNASESDPIGGQEEYIPYYQAERDIVNSGEAPQILPSNSKVGSSKQGKGKWSVERWDVDQTIRSIGVLRNIFR